jgi:ABC-type antimicrobial peptide transport system permease subunit
MFNTKRDNRTLGLRVVSSKADDVIASLEKIWYEVNEEYEFSYIFLDEDVAQFYEGERKMSQMLTVFAGIAIFIGCLGLYGLVAFMANQKAKEIGIRKVLGASVANLMSRFSKEFIFLVLIAFPFAAVLGYFGMSSWLQQYEYRIDIGPLIFIVSIAASIIIAMLTTGYRSMRAATANPVNSLRDQ